MTENNSFDDYIDEERRARRAQMREEKRPSKRRPEKNRSEDTRFENKYKKSEAAKKLDFIEAAALRDEMLRMQAMLDKRSAE